ncbi:MAG: hypothetical protein WDZ76_15265 [Pseudohongiellaceae bacterium]
MKASQSLSIKNTLASITLGLSLLLALNAPNGTAAKAMEFSHYDGATGVLTVPCVAHHGSDGEILLNEEGQPLLYNVILDTLPDMNLSLRTALLLDADSITDCSGVYRDGMYSDLVYAESVGPPWDGNVLEVELALLPDEDFQFMLLETYTIADLDPDNDEAPVPTRYDGATGVLTLPCVAHHGSDGEILFNEEGQPLLYNVILDTLPDMNLSLRTALLLDADSITDCSGVYRDGIYSDLVYAENVGPLWDGNVLEVELALLPGEGVQFSLQTYTIADLDLDNDETPEQTPPDDDPEETGPEVEEPPIVPIPPVPGLTVAGLAEDTTLTVALTATDADTAEAALDYTLTALPPVTADTGILLYALNLDGSRGAEITAVPFAVPRTTAGVAGLHLEPVADWFGSTTFTYSIGDGSYTITQTVDVTVTAVDDPPLLLSLEPQGDEDTPFVIELELAADNAFGETDTLVFSIVEVPLAGTLHTVSNPDDRDSEKIGAGDSVDPDEVYYWGFQDYNGPDSLRYSVSDGAFTPEQEVSIIVSPVNDEPFASMETPLCVEDTSCVFTLDGVDVDNSDANSANHFNLVSALFSISAEGGAFYQYDADVYEENDPDTYGDELDIETDVTDPDRQVIYVPRADANTDFDPFFSDTAVSPSFEYLVKDQALTSDELLININIAPVNDAPVNGVESLALVIDTEARAIAIPIKNISDIDNLPEDFRTRITALGLPVDAFLTQDASSTVNVVNGNVSGLDLFFTPEDDAVAGPDYATFAYRGHDGALDSAVETQVQIDLVDLGAVSGPVNIVAGLELAVGVDASDVPIPFDDLNPLNPANLMVKITAMDIPAGASLTGTPDLPEDAVVAEIGTAYKQLFFTPDADVEPGDDYAEITYVLHDADGDSDSTQATRVVIHLR